MIFDWFWLAGLLWRECDVPGLSRVTKLWRCCHTNAPAPPRFHPWAPPELLSLQQHQPHPSLFDLFPVWHQPQQSLVTNQPWREHTGMCFQGEGFLFDLLAPRGREGASHLVQCFIHSHVIKISWIYSSACLYLETFQHHERWHKQIMELPLCTARRQNRPREKTISLEINCALCLGIHCSVPHKAEGKEMKSHPPLLGCWPGSQGQRGAVPTWEALRAPLELSWWWDGHQALAGTFRDPPASEQAQLRAVTRQAQPQGPCTNPVPRAGLVSVGGGGS